MVARMASKKPLYTIVAGVALFAGVPFGGCYVPPSSDEAFEESIVITAHDEAADFASYGTYFVRPQIRILDEGRETEEDETPEFVSDVIAAPLIATTETNLSDRGYTVADSAEEADLAVEIIYLRSVNSQQYCYAYWGWYDWYYWGYPYYPYYPYCDTSVWRSGTLITFANDMNAVVPPIQPVRDAGPGFIQGNPGDLVLRSIWTSAIYGAEVDSAQYVAERGIAGINQAFIQSPYFTAAP